MINSNFDSMIRKCSGEDLTSGAIKTVQVNVGLRCNQSCTHCHLACSPERPEIMPWSVMEAALKLIKGVECRLIEITGGAPELNPDFRRFVEAASRLSAVQVRTNLTILTEPGMEDIPDFYVSHDVSLVGSLPCYLEDNVNAQRGEGAYSKSISAIRMLNEKGYGLDPDRRLDLVYNPAGPVLPPPQAALEADYRAKLSDEVGIHFSNLIAITNMPLGRFLEGLRREGTEGKYRRLLVDNFNPDTLDHLMCRHQLDIGWDGVLYDCDFNLALGLSVDHGASSRIEFFDREIHEKRRIVTGEHCFGCAAGSGSSCGGVLI